MLMPLTHRQVDIIRLGLTGILEANQKSKSKYKGFFEKLGFSQLKLTDINIPKIDGFELYQKMKKWTIKLKICFITGYEIHYKALKEVSSNRSREDGSDYLSKTY